MFDAAAAHEWLVRPSIPVLYFGDLNRYLNSELRIITVGLNPSGREFPRDNPFRRFPAARDLDRERHGWEAMHSVALNEYFIHEPYSAWFGAWEPVLAGMNASYWSAPSTALHTDICSQLPTSPTWSGLDGDAKVSLEADGHPLWRDLAALLEPHVILISVAANYLRRMTALPVQTWSLIHTVEGPTRRPLEIRGTLIEWPGGHKSLAVFGRAANLPLGTVSHLDKTTIGKAVALASAAGGRR